jgi:hypothetical protein
MKMTFSAAALVAAAVLAGAETFQAREQGQGLLYGRVTADDGAVYEGRLRFGGDEEAFWGNYFNGVKATNPWAVHAPRELTEKRRPVVIFGFELPVWQREVNLQRPLMARFGDIVRLEASGRNLRVTLKSGTTFHLDRYAADDFADGVRVWDVTRGVIDLDEWRVRSIEFLPTGALAEVPRRLYGVVRTKQGDFTGFIQWDRQQCAGPDELIGLAADGQQRRLRFETIRSIARRSAESAAVTLGDGTELVLSGTSAVGRDHRGIYVDDHRYGRVLVSWEAFERVDFSAASSGPAYSDFPAGRPLTGSVTTRDGRRLTGRLVYDLDESETTETLDAPSGGVDYTIPFGLVASIAPHTGGAGRARVTLHDGETLLLERNGDLSAANAGLLIFIGDQQHAQYVPWADVTRIDVDRPPAMYPPPAAVSINR